MTTAQEFEACIADWESNDGWQFADRKAERKFFYLAGRNAGLERVIALLPPQYSYDPEQFAIAIRKEME